MKFATIAAVLATSVDARFFMGRCPEVRLVQTFDTDRFLGKWYEFARDSWFPYTQTAECVTKEWVPTKEGNMRFTFEGYYTLWGSRASVGGQAFCHDGTSETFTCQSTMDRYNGLESHYGQYGKTSPYKIVATDYENYEITHMCTEYLYGWMRSEHVMIYSKHK